MNNTVLNWLLEGDPSIRWQVMRDLFDRPLETYKTEQQRVATEGWGARLLSVQDVKGTWGGGLYSPKWISTTYTLQLLRRLGLPTGIPSITKACGLLLENGFYHDGGINFFASLNHSETCVTGMVLAILSHFEIQDARIPVLAEHLLAQQLPDGGWNCNSYLGHRHSSFHTTISVLEGLREFEKCDQSLSDSITEARNRAVEFLLLHRLFRSHRTGEIVDKRMTRMSFPPRWRYDFLRALDHFQECKLPYDERMEDAIQLLIRKCRADATWPLQARHPGRTFFDMEIPGKPSRWNTLRSLRVLRFYPDTGRRREGTAR